MTLSPEWILGTILTLMLAVIGYLYKYASDIKGELTTRIENGENALASRIAETANIVDGVKEDYVRRIDNDGKMGRIEKTTDELRTDVKEVSAMLVKVLLALGKKVD